MHGQSHGDPGLCKSLWDPHRPWYSGAAGALLRCEVLGSQGDGAEGCWVACPALHPLTFSSPSSCGLTSAAEAACRGPPPQGGLGPSLAQPFGKIHNKPVQKPPRSTCPPHPHRQELPPAPEHPELPGETPGPGARARLPDASRKLHVYLLELFGVGGGGVSWGGGFNPLVLFCTDVQNSLSRPWLSKSSRVSFASCCFSSLNPVPGSVQTSPPFKGACHSAEGPGGAARPGASF